MKKRDLSIKKFDKQRLNKKCFICDKTFWSLEIHHKDMNPSNNKKSNLLILCAECHQLIHNNKLVDDDNPTKKRKIINYYRSILFDEIMREKKNE